MKDIFSLKNVVLNNEFKSININELDSIIEKIGKSLYNIQYFVIIGTQSLDKNELCIVLLEYYPNIYISPFFSINYEVSCLFSTK